MNTKTKLTFAIIFVAFSAWFYFTPHLAVSGMKSAAEAKDAAKLAGYVDFPALKESLKAGFNAKIAAEVAKKKDGEAFAAFGAAMAAALINPMVDALVSPEGLARVMQGEKLRPAPQADHAKSSGSGTETSMAYEGFDRFVVTVRKKDSPAEPVGLVFNRDGLFSWKLSGLRLPL